MNDPYTSAAAQAQLALPHSETASAEPAAADAEPSPMGQYLGALCRCAARSATPADVVRRVTEIAFSDPADAVALACGQQCRPAADMDLAAVSEFKCKDGLGEVKFLDRLRALELLWSLLGGGSGGEDAAAQAFLQALEDRAAPEGEVTGDR